MEDVAIEGLLDERIGQDHQCGSIVCESARLELDRLIPTIAEVLPGTVTWDTLHHPLRGVIMSHNSFPMVSEWTENENANEFVKNYRDVNQFELIGLSTKANILIDRTGRACLATSDFSQPPQILQTSHPQVRDSHVAQW